MLCANNVHSPPFFFFFVFCQTTKIFELVSFLVVNDKRWQSVLMILLCFVLFLRLRSEPTHKFDKKRNKAFQGAELKKPSMSTNNQHQSGKNVSDTSVMLSQSLMFTEGSDMSDSSNQNTHNKHSSKDWRTVLSPSVAFFGVQLILALESGDGSAYLSELGLSEQDLGYAWLAAPLLGLVLQPCVGAWSDRCSSKYGRRRPFIGILGGLLAILCAIFSNASSLGQWLGDHPGDKDVRPVGLSIGLVCLFLIDLTINCVEGLRLFLKKKKEGESTKKKIYLIDGGGKKKKGPLRALISDTCDEQQQVESNSFFGVQNGLAQACGYLLVAIIFITAMSWGIGAFVLLFCIIFTLMSVKEKPVDAASFHRMHDQPINFNKGDGKEINDDDGDDDDDNDNDNDNDDASISNVVINGVTKNGFVAVKDSKKVRRSSSIIEHKHMFREVLQEIWWGWKHVPDEHTKEFDQYEKGVSSGLFTLSHFFFFFQSLWNKNLTIEIFSLLLVGCILFSPSLFLANYAYMAMSLVGGIFAILLVSTQIDLFHTKQKITAALIMTPIFIGGPVGGAIAVHSLVGLGLCASFSLPWAIVTKYSLLYDQSRSGLWSTIFNSSECVAEILVSLAAGNLADAFKHSTAVVMVLGGISLVIASFLVLRVRDPSHAFQYDKIEPASSHEQTQIQKEAESWK
ncbi:sucrose transporter2 [Reticulomyxa filosa]|uniref:Sucrose transporter2 n=1 Tax=Reticulomyxa filosa TaxID=46433 RepID=X6M6A5_RETFI|nr:sucrose transporter2 [Reticulomyxa filosa]|eukprot:ETO08560.1 sucrose transporter2 [Reticulomyxa filosa]